MNREKSDGPANLATKSSEASNPKKNLLGKFGAKVSLNLKLFGFAYSGLLLPVILNLYLHKLFLCLKKKIAGVKAQP